MISLQLTKIIRARSSIIFLPHPCNCHVRSVYASGSEVLQEAPLSNVQEGDEAKQSLSFIAGENKHVHRILKSLPEYSNTFFDSRPLNSSDKWMAMNPVVRNFRDYIYQQREFSEDFDPTVTSPIVSQKSSLTDEELRTLLYLTTIPQYKPNAHLDNFQKLWRGLDEECIFRTSRWTNYENLVVADLWFLNRLHGISEFHWVLVKKLLRKCGKLNKAEFVRFMFCLNLTRKLPDSINLYELEHFMINHVADFNAIEVGMVAMAFFKTKTMIRDTELLTNCLEIASMEARSLDSVFLAAICKIGRLSGQNKTAAVLYSFQEKFLPELPRLNTTTAMHLAIVGTRIQFLHEPLLRTVLRKAENDLKLTRLKDIERLLLVFTMFNIDCDRFCQLVIDELRTPTRQEEITSYGRSLPSILFYLSIRQFYPNDLIERVFDPLFLRTHYGRNNQKYQRELLCLDFAVGLENPDYCGKNLDTKVRKSVTKINLLWLWPETQERVSAYENSIRIVARFVKHILGGPQFIYTCNILPHFHSAETVFFLDSTNTPVEIPTSFREIEVHDVKTLPADFTTKGIRAHALLTCGNNMIVRNRERTPLGQIKFQQRLLAKMGYTTHLVFPSDITQGGLSNDAERNNKITDQFLHNLIINELSVNLIQSK